MPLLATSLLLSLLPLFLLVSSSISFSFFFFASFPFFSVSFRTSFFIFYLISFRFPSSSLLSSRFCYSVLFFSFSLSLSSSLLILQFFSLLFSHLFIPFFSLFSLFFRLRIFLFGKYGGGEMTQCNAALSMWPFFFTKDYSRGWPDLISGSVKVFIWGWYVIIIRRKTDFLKYFFFISFQTPF